MRNYFVLMLLCLAFSSTAALAQDTAAVLDLNALIAETKDAGSTYYYPNLLKRFTGFDTTLTDKEVFMLQLGFTETKNYKPYSIGGELEKGNKAFEKGDYKDAAKAYNNALDENPLSIDGNWKLAQALKKVGDVNGYFQHKRKAMQLINGILSTGDGKSKATAYIVTHVRDEYIILSYLGYSSGGQSLVKGEGHTYDMLTGLKDDETGNKRKKDSTEKIEIYFNIDLPFGSMAKMLLGK